MTGSGSHVSMSGLEFTIEPRLTCTSGSSISISQVPGVQEGQHKAQLSDFSSIIFKIHEGFPSGKRKNRLQIANPFKCQEKGDEDCVDIFIFHKLVAFLLMAPHFLSHGEN